VKKVMMIWSALLLLVLAACGDIDEKNSREVTPKNEVAAEAQVEAGEEVVEEEVIVEKPVGTRSNPLPFGETITVKENIYDDTYNAYESYLEITLLESIRGQEAWAIIEKENMFNEPAADGFEYVLIKVKGFLKESETDDDSLYFSNMNFNFVSNEGEVYEWVSAVVPNELSKELYNGGAGEGFIANQEKIVDDIKVSYDSSEGSPVFFYVQ
jgi:hypothetical protein